MTDIRTVRDMNGLIRYFSDNLGWEIDLNDFDDIEDISYEFEAADIGLKDEAFAKISSMRQLQPMTDDQRWGIFCIEFESQKFEVSAIRKILSGLIPRRRASVDHAMWLQQDLLFICNWGEGNNKTIGLAHFEDKVKGLPQIKMISCAPAVEDFTQISKFEENLKQLSWPRDTSNIQAWRDQWSNAFSVAYREVIQTSSRLTVRLAAEAQNIRDLVLSVLEVENESGYVHKLYEKFRQALIHDMTETAFADMYAQTVVYGLFSARCMDTTQEDFSVKEAVTCIPNTNPFLRELMKECLGADARDGDFIGADKRLYSSFDELDIGNVVDLLAHTNTDAIIRDFNRQTGGGKEDPIIHFYEEFLTAYDKQQKVQRGVFYTPQPVVSFMVRAVDDILKNEFGYEDGLASIETKEVEIVRKSKKKNERGFYFDMKDAEEVPAVQVLDPATGTGTFLRQVILQIYDNFRAKHRDESEAAIKAAWNEYVPKHLLPRINGFELMMAPYAVAHMKLAMVLHDTGYEFGTDARLNVCLTNTLEPPGDADDQISFFSDPLAMESIEANKVKKNEGINIILGNPPYNVSSNNRNPWILDLISDYKMGLTEKKLNLDDDYIKFLKYAQNIIDTKPQGIIAYITNNSYIDGVSHRRIRESILNSFNQIYVLDLHGNIMKQEHCEDGSKDENVFDIQQGVSIVLLVKGNGITRFVKHISIMGKREHKYNALNSMNLDTIKWNTIQPNKPELLFIPYNYDTRDSYSQGFKVSDLFSLYNSGIQTKCDELSVGFTENEVRAVVEDFISLSVEQLKLKYKNKKDSSGWSFSKAKEEICRGQYIITPYYYRPFDVRYVVYTGKSGGFIGRSREVVMQHVVGHTDNLCLCMMKQFFQDVKYNHIFVSNLPIDERTLYSNRGGTYLFPLYQYNKLSGQRTYNFNNSVIQSIERCLGKKLSTYQATETFTGEELIAYIYAVLYSNEYRNKYNDQLKYDFPSIPYPSSAEIFMRLVELGEELISLHLPHSFYPAGGDVVLEELQSYKFVDDQVVLNDSFYIQALPNISDQMIGGYRPADKWLKDHKGKKILVGDVDVYKHIITAMKKTNEIMDEIDKVMIG